MADKNFIDALSKELCEKFGFKEIKVKDLESNKFSNDEVMNKDNKVKIGAASTEISDALKNLVNVLFTPSGVNTQEAEKVVENNKVEDTSVNGILNLINEIFNKPNCEFNNICENPPCIDDEDDDDNVDCDVEFCGGCDNCDCSCGASGVDNQPKISAATIKNKLKRDFNKVYLDQEIDKTFMDNFMNVIFNYLSYSLEMEHYSSLTTNLDADGAGVGIFINTKVWDDTLWDNAVDATSKKYTNVFHEDSFCNISEREMDVEKSPKFKESMNKMIQKLVETYQFSSGTWGEVENGNQLSDTGYLFKLFF